VTFPFAPTAHARFSSGILERSPILPIIEVGYALVDGRHTVYIPVTKRADASTLSVVNLVKENLPKFQAVLPQGAMISYEFDQSPFVTRAILGLTEEGLLGAVLTGLMVLLFLRDWRSALIVVVNIPLSIMAAMVALWASGQTVNLMTLGGLALAVGILVDEATVTIENLHSHIGRGVSRGSPMPDQIVAPDVHVRLSFARPEPSTPSRPNRFHSPARGGELGCFQE
jgi:Cu/Ag efflux pump CusA